MSNFPCIACGHCCTKLHLNSLYQELHQGDGICQHLDLNSKRCTIYTARPIICRVDQMYELYYQEQLTREAYYRLNKSFCIQWQTESDS